MCGTSPFSLRPTRCQVWPWKAAEWDVNLIQPLANWLSYSALRLPHDSLAGESVAFFLYDVPKILLLLSGMIFVVFRFQRLTASA